MTETFDWLQVAPRLRAEVHFDDRVLDCFTERPGSLYALLQGAAARNPEGEALIAGDLRLTWRAFADAVERLAAGLATRGLARGDRLAMLVGNRPEFVLAFFAAARLGAIAVPMSTRMQAPEIAYAATNCGAALLLFDAELAGRLPDAVALPSVRHLVSVAGHVPGAQAFDELLASTAIPGPPCAVHEDDTAVILYTSGTTGLPKGAMLSHLGIIHSALVYSCCMQLGPRDRTIAAVPLSHVTGIVAEIAAFTHAAGTLILLPAFKDEAFLQLAARERMTHTVMVPAMYNLCLLSPRFGEFDLSCWRVGGYGGAPMPVPTIDALAQRLPGLRLMNAYGATETTSPAVLMPPSETRDHPDCVGRAVPGVDIRIMDEMGRELPPGEVGEVWIKGASVVRGYWDDPAATRESIVGGYWRSGDVGSTSPAGHLAVLDRKKDMINRGGYKVFTAEVETVLAGHPAVVESAVIARPCPVLGERVHAVVVTRGSTPAAADLRAHCAGRLSDYKVPETFDIRVDPLPRNAGGKVMKRMLREALTSG